MTLITKQQPKKYRKLRPEVPLRGHLIDPRSGGMLMGSGSTSKNGCNRPTTAYS